MNQPTQPPYPFIGTAIVAAGTAVTFASLDPAAIRTALAPAGPRPVIAAPVLTHIAAVMAGLVELRAAVECPGVALHEAEFGPDGRNVTLTAWDVRSLSAWYDVYRTRCSAAVRSRVGGGLEWTLSLGEVLPGVRVYVWTESGEGEVLPDTALVRAMCPEQARLRQIREREAAHALRMGWVA